MHTSEQTPILTPSYETILGPNPDILGGGGTPYNDLQGEALPERDTFFRFRVYERVGISLVERVVNSVILVCNKAQKD